MPKKDLGAALGKSIQAETKKVKDRPQAVDDRFAKAEQLLESESTPSLSEPEKPKNRKRDIRDSITLPSHDYELITAIRSRCLDSRVTINKSEVIRAGLHALNEMSNSELLAVVDSLTKIKTGRPGKAQD